MNPGLIDFLGRSFLRVELILCLIGLLITYLRMTEEEPPRGDLQV